MYWQSLFKDTAEPTKKKKKKKKTKLLARKTSVENPPGNGDKHVCLDASTKLKRGFGATKGRWTDWQKNSLVLL